MIATASVALALAAPLVIAHRGASGERPEHTLAAYELAIAQGADFIEPDLVMTRDGVLIARHENEIAETTDVVDRPEFAGRRTTKLIDGKSVTGWFAEDFSLAEIKTLRAKERLPQLRPQSTAWDGLLEVPTFAEVLALARRAGVGVYPELKHPSFLATQGLDPVPPLLAELGRAALPPQRVMVQCFEVAPLERMARQTGFRRVQLIAADEGPFDRQDLSVQSMTSSHGLARIATYADGIGVQKDLVIPRLPTGELGEPTALVRMAHASGLVVHVWTFRNEDAFLPAGLKGNPEIELERFLAAGIDGFFTDWPATGRAVVARRAGSP